MIWVLEIEGVPDPAWIDVDDAIDDLLTALEQTPDVFGAVAFANEATATVGVRFDVEAADSAGALAGGTAIFVQAARVAGASAITFRRTEVAHEDVLASYDW